MTSVACTTTAGSRVVAGTTGTDVLQGSSGRRLLAVRALTASSLMGRRPSGDLQAKLTRLPVASGVGGPRHCCGWLTRIAAAAAFHLVSHEQAAFVGAGDKLQDCRLLAVVQADTVNWIHRNIMSITQIDTALRSQLAVLPPH